MIQFMVLGGPRSATTWLANLLTTDSTLCLHDPLLEHKSTDLDSMEIPDKRIGIADTSALLWPEWVAGHPAPKIILWRDPRRINESLAALGLRQLDAGRHCMRINRYPKIPIYPWRAIFQAPIANEICKLFNVPFDRYRFQELLKMNIQPHFSRLPVGKEAVIELLKRIQKEIENG